MKTKTELDELDVKLLNELPLIAEILVGTTNKIAHLLNPIVKEMVSMCNEYVPKGWDVEDFNKEKNNITPFCGSISSSRIQELEKQFLISNTIEVVKKEGKKTIQQISFDCGFYYSDEDERKTPYFYIGMTKYINSKKGDKAMFMEKDYEEMAASFDGYNNYIWHPDSEDEDDDEAIEIQIDITKSKELKKVSDLFIEKIMIPVLCNKTLIL